LLIRKEQIDALQRATDRNYEIRLVYFLRNQFPDAELKTEASLVDGIGPQIVKARGYGLITEQQIAVYVTSAWLLGGDFDNAFPAAKEMLNSSVMADHKSDWLEHFTEKLFERLGQRI
jgi:hypothetical protein